MWDGHDGMGWWMLFGSVWFVLFWGLILWAIYALAPRLGFGRPEAPPRDDDPLEIAKRRYARGEISREEYEQLRADLQ